METDQILITYKYLLFLLIDHPIDHYKKVIGMGLISDQIFYRVIAKGISIGQV